MKQNDAKMVTDTQKELKHEAAKQAIAFLESGMIVGLGSGTTAAIAVELIGKALKSGDIDNIVGIPTSVATEHLAKVNEIPLATLEEYQMIDVTIDGADEVDSNLQLIKGGHGALLREKIIAQMSKKNVIIVDESKLSPCLGYTWAVPVEVIPFAWKVEKKFLEFLGGSVVLRRNEQKNIFVTDEGNYILDTTFGKMCDPSKFLSKLNGRAGIVEHGLFIDLATDVIVSTKNGVFHLEKGALTAKDLKLFEK